MDLGLVRESLVKLNAIRLEHLTRQDRHMDTLDQRLKKALLAAINLYFPEFVRESGRIWYKKRRLVRALQDYVGCAK
ncbi:hypothetical protein HMPREF0421_20262 [Gardnerella vaginalis ATCC 14019]|uniref:Uncharacterized protein n=1 Tax=Gardnerella vaginalis (strain ATCC 14019 / 317) TaxID=525284 RepID=E3D8F2_GARV3|nr:hypothetical protein HMPREF0421_20262 [Gardnerella vaginalis ATCC 14019]